MTSGVGILKLSILLYSNIVIFHVQVEVHVEFTVILQLMVGNS